jgi:Spy/CpxP family protein refolding chaperone
MSIPAPLPRVARVLRAPVLVLCVAASGFLTACAASTDTAASSTEGSSSEVSQAEEAAPGAAAEEESAAEVEASERPRLPFFHTLDGMDLREEQKSRIAAIEGKIGVQLTRTERAGRSLFTSLADGVEKGGLDERTVQLQRSALEAQADASIETVKNAANELHGVLDPAQRQELVLTLRAEREERRRQWESHETEHEGAHHHGPFGAVARELGLSEQQRQSLRDGAKKLFDGAFPAIKARREKHRAELVAMEEAFMSDDFDAHRFSFGDEAKDVLHTASGPAVKLVDLAASVLTRSQRESLATRLRAHGAPR